MRDYRFRGFTKEGKEVKGSLITSKDGKQTYIGYSEPLEDRYGFAIIHYDKVLPETVSQWTGLKDKNGKDIYEGDIVKDKYGNILNVEWTDNSHQPYFGRIVNKSWGYPIDKQDEVEIIGNIHENQEVQP